MCIQEDICTLLPQLRRRAQFLSGNWFDADDIVQNTYEAAITFLQKNSNVKIENTRRWMFTILKWQFKATWYSKKKQEFEDDVTDQVVPPSAESRVELQDVLGFIGCLGEGRQQKLLAHAIGVTGVEQAGGSQSSISISSEVRVAQRQLNCLIEQCWPDRLIKSRRDKYRRTSGPKLTYAPGWMSLSKWLTGV